MPKPRKDLRSEKWVFKAQGCFRNMSKHQQYKSNDIYCITRISEQNSMQYDNDFEIVFWGNLYQ